MDIEPLRKKWEAFNWNVIECKGHDHMEIIHAYQKAKEFKGKPSVIIAETIMGKGVKSIEGDYKWHGKAPSLEEAKVFINELEDRSI